MEKTEIFDGIDFALPKRNKTEAAKRIGAECGRVWATVDKERLPHGLPPEVEAWRSTNIRHAWRVAMAEGWHAARAKDWPVFGKDPQVDSEIHQLDALVNDGISEKRESDAPKVQKVTESPEYGDVVAGFSSRRPLVTDLRPAYGDRSDYRKISAMVSPETYAALMAEFTRRKVAKSPSATLSAVVDEALHSYLGGKGNA